jgi:hypothetical protein
VEAGDVVMTRARQSLATALVCSSLLVQGCAYYRVVVPEPTPATDYETATMNAYLWGVIEDTQPTDNCLSNALDEVRVRRTFPQALATVLTLGIWMPLEVQWKCAKPPQREGSDF